MKAYFAAILGIAAMLAEGPYGDYGTPRKRNLVRINLTSDRSELLQWYNQQPEEVRDFIRDTPDNRIEGEDYKVFLIRAKIHNLLKK
jgi:hypothetical protein